MGQPNPAGTQAEQGLWSGLPLRACSHIRAVPGNLNQVLVGVSEVDGGYWTHSTSSGHGTFFNGHPTGLEDTGEQGFDGHFITVPSSPSLDNMNCWMGQLKHSPAKCHLQALDLCLRG